jgi:hypothetical protein
LFQLVFKCLCCLHPTVAGSASGGTHYRGHLCVRFRYGLTTRCTLKVSLSIDFSVSVSLNTAIQATGLLAFTLAGLSPAEHTSLRWTYNCTCPFQDIQLKLSFIRLSLWFITKTFGTEYPMLQSFYIPLTCNQSPGFHWVSGDNVDFIKYEVFATVTSLLKPAFSFYSVLITGWKSAPFQVC